MSVVDEIKQRLDVVEVIGSYVALKKAGATFKGLCPFHTEKTPSFVVFPNTQSWHCFGACGTGGDIFSFVMRHENLDFGEALKLLAQRAGVELEPLSTGAREHAEVLERLREVNVIAAEYYHRVLIESQEAAGARAYLERRQMSPASLRSFQVGFAPNDWHRLGEHLRSKGVSQQEALDAGLLTRNDAGNVYDRFRGRIMFPIRDIQGHVVGFGGRVLDDSQPKYLNTPQTELFDKSSVLYGIDRARQSIRETGTAIIVEGYMDVILPHQFGATNLVACMGTALSESHISVLKRLCNTVILALDADEAGQRAAERGTLAAAEHLPKDIVPVPDARGMIRYEERLGAEVRVLLLPDGMDPDELILSDRAQWDSLVEEALPVPEFHLQRARQTYDVSTARGKQEGAEHMLGIIASLDNPVQRAHYVQRIAQWVRVDERTLSRRLDALRRESGTQPARRRAQRSIEQSSEKTSGDTAAGTAPEEHVLSLVIKSPRLASSVVEETGIDESSFEDPRHREIFRALIPFMHNPDAPYNTGDIIAALDTESGTQVESLARQISSGPPMSEDMYREDLIKACTRLRRQEVGRRMQELRYVQMEAEDEGEIRDLGARIATLTVEYLRIERLFQSATYTGKRQQQQTGSS
ncbi:MAG: DNA primase [Anaerolineae bacterium]|jgi:DNA primase|nr:DNA primase [Chloroflexota bacterium]